MKISLLLKDRIPRYGIWAAGIALTAIFLSAFRVPIQALCAAVAIPLLAGIVGEWWEINRKKVYYDKLTNAAEQLDKKYLLAEMTPQAEFCEGKFLNETLREAGKAMSEQVAHYRREASDFREYIELWVHEIKLPVAGLLLKCHNDHADFRYIEQLRRIDDEIENVLYYARSESPEHDFLFKETSLKRAVTDAVMKNRDLLREKDVAIKTEGLDEIVWTDAKWLSFILGQLIANSLKYISSDRAPEWRFSARVVGDKTALVFRDNGIGIPAEDLPRIFEKSFTGRNGRIGSASTGMGLYIVRRLCNKMGHGVWVESREGEYTEMTLIFGKNDLYRFEEKIGREQPDDTMV